MLWGGEVNGPKNDMVGQVFSRLTVIRWEAQFWVCRCECGNEIRTVANRLQKQLVRSCGCLKREQATRHGMHGSTEYVIWHSMLQRCFNPKNTRYANYGGRGITVCDYWRHNFKAWLKDMGPRPPGTSLDRIDNESHYMPGNCRWATPAEQARNQRRTRLISYGGQTQTITDWANQLGCHPMTLHYRLGRGGWTVERALTTRGESG